MKNSEIAAGMRECADWLDSNPDMEELPYDPMLRFIFVADRSKSRSQIADLARRMGKCTKDATNELFSVVRMFGPFKLEGIAYRENVCERIITGTETVKVPAVEAQPEREEIREKVEWKCSPLTAVEFPAERLLGAANIPQLESTEVPF